jgi:predicted transcriptional regulator of viral defense system
LPKTTNCFIFDKNRSTFSRRFFERVKIGVGLKENRIAMRAGEYIRELASNGRHHFTTADAVKVVEGNLSAVRAQLRRLKQQGLTAEPVRGFHVVVPPEYQRLGCLPAEHFIDQLMQVWGEPYYVGLLSAAERHGAAHQRPQATQVMVRKNRQAISCGQVRVEFIARSDLEKMPISKINTPRGALRYSTPEVTALELVGYPRYAGGLDNVATVLAELSEEMAADKLLDVARLCPISWSQRLGYLLELVGQPIHAQALLPFIQEHALSYTPLRRAASIAGGRRIPSWKLIVNVTVEPDE